MKIIFLDLDGVLIKFPSKERKSRADKTILNNFIFDKELVVNLKNIIKETNAKIVISSSWRHNMERVDNAFIEANLDLDLDFIFNKTPSDLWYWRWNEILTWLNDYHKTCKNWYHITNWCVIDDDDFDMKCIKKLWKLVKIDANFWLVDIHEVINLLNN